VRHARRFLLLISRWTEACSGLLVGDRAPVFTAVAHDGSQFSLADYVGRQIVVLFFYPKDGMPICAQEACAFRDAYADFVEAGALVVGVSGDSVQSHRRFADARRLPFILLSDHDGAIRKSFGVPKSLGIFPGRVSYVIDKQGIVQLVFNSQLQASQHAANALRVVMRLAAELPQPH
jgi:thioredoxin-dependent peroxiredoxin